MSSPSRVNRRAEDKLVGGGGGNGQANDIILLDLLVASFNLSGAMRQAGEPLVFFTEC